MRKEFSFKNYFLYTLRYWLIVALCAVVGLGAGILYGVFTTLPEKTVMRGSIAIGGMSLFFDNLQDKTDNLSNAYNTVKSEAFNAMTSDWVSRGVYAQFENEWCAQDGNKKLTKQEAREKFYECYGQWTSGYYMYVTFTQNRNTKDAEKEAAACDFSARVVNATLDLALQSAVDHEPMLNEPGKLTVIEAVADTTQDDKTNIGMLKGSLVGVIGGIVVGFVITLIMYALDRRITAYGDIAAVTGRKLLDASKGPAASKACPRIDCELGKKTVLLLCGSEDTVRRLGEAYGEYAAGAGQKTLRVDFTVNGKPDTFADCLSGKPLAECAENADGVTVLYGTQSWALVNTYEEKMKELRRSFGRIVLCAPYRGDGSLSVLSGASDVVVVAVDQSRDRVQDVWTMAQELQAPDALAGAVIEKTGKCFVGGNMYVPVAEEE